MSKDVQAAIVIVFALIVLVLARCWQLTIYKQRGLGKPRRFGLGQDLDPRGAVTAQTCPNPWAVDRLHLGYAVAVRVYLAA